MTKEHCCQRIAVPFGWLMLFIDAVLHRINSKIPRSHNMLFSFLIDYVETPAGRTDDTPYLSRPPGEDGRNDRLLCEQDGAQRSRVALEDVIATADLYG